MRSQRPNVGARGLDAILVESMDGLTIHKAFGRSDRPQIIGGNTCQIWCPNIWTVMRVWTVRPSKYFNVLRPLMSICEHRYLWTVWRFITLCERLFFLIWTVKLSIKRYVEIFSECYVIWKRASRRYTCGLLVHPKHAYLYKKSPFSWQNNKRILYFSLNSAFNIDTASYSLLQWITIVEVRRTRTYVLTTTMGWIWNLPTGLMNL